jgi:hypothetical protein
MADDLAALLDPIRERGLAITLEDLDRAVPAVREALKGDRSNPDYFAALVAEAVLKTYHPFYRADVFRLLKAVEAALDGHEPVPAYGPALNPDGTSACGHDFDDARHFEVSVGEWACQGDPGPPVCARCSDALLVEEEAEWPCRDYRAITGALTGEQLSEDGNHG